MKRILASLTILIAATALSAETYTIDSVHSSVGFSLRHMVSKFTSSFTKVSGIINYDAAKPEASSVEATIAIDSVATANEKRDAHLKSPDFFDFAKFPAASFKSKAWKKTGENTFDVTGDLTIKDVTKEVVLKTTLVGSGPGNSRGRRRKGRSEDADVLGLPRHRRLADRVPGGLSRPPDRRSTRGLSGESPPGVP